MRSPNILLSHRGDNLLQMLPGCNIRFGGDGTLFVMELKHDRKVGTYLLRRKNGPHHRGGTKKGKKEAEESPSFLFETCALAFGLFLFAWIDAERSVMHGVAVDSGWQNEYLDAARSLTNYGMTGEGLMVSGQIPVPYARDFAGTIASFDYVNLATERLVELGAEAPRLLGSIGTGVGARWKMVGTDWEKTDSYEVTLYNTSFGARMNPGRVLVYPPPEAREIGKLYRDAIIEQVILMKDIGMVEEESTNGLSAVLNLKLGSHSGVFHHDPLGTPYQVVKPDGVVMTNMNEVDVSFYRGLMRLLGLAERQVDKDVHNTVISMAYGAGDEPGVFAADEDIGSGKPYSITRPRDKSVTFAKQSSVSHAGATTMAPRDCLVIISRAAKKGEEVGFLPRVWESELVVRHDTREGGSSGRKRRRTRRRAFRKKGRKHRSRRRRR